MKTRYDVETGLNFCGGEDPEWELLHITDSKDTLREARELLRENRRAEGRPPLFLYRIVKVTREVVS